MSRFIFTLVAIVVLLYNPDESGSTVCPIATTTYARASTWTRKTPIRTHTCTCTCKMAGSNGVSYIRGRVARTVYNRIKEDEETRQRQHPSWYSLNVSSLPEGLQGQFLPSHQDADTNQFLETCYEKADWIFTQMYHTFAKSILSWFFTQTSINGLLNRGSMFVLSRKHFQDLLGIDDGWKADTLLDLGAGDGMVTEKMSSHFSKVYVTETSLPMRWRLEEKGYTVLGVEDWCSNDASPQYDLISCLNLLDRCDQPLTLLQNIKLCLRHQTGILIVAVVLPFKTYVETTSDHRPTEQIIIEGQTIEEQVASFINSVLVPAGWDVLRFTKLPYLCQGDIHHSFYVLYDIVFVLKPKTNHVS